MTKQLVTKKVSGIDKWMLDGSTLKEISAIIAEAIAQHGEDAVLDISLESYGYGDGDYIEVSLQKKVLETDEEYALRTATETAQELERRAWREQQYKALQKEFEGKP